MSMEMRVFFAGPIPTAQALERTMAEIGLSFKITEHVSLGDHSGFLPMTYGLGEDLDETGVEVYSDPAAPDIEDLGITGVDPAFVEQLSFRWGSDMMACGTGAERRLQHPRIPDSEPHRAPAAVVSDTKY
jgi:hypothetical protein